MASDQEFIDLYISCLREVLERGWANEVRENRERPSIDTIGRIQFFHEYAFCVYVSGFKWKTVNMRWPDLTRIFKGWDNDQVCENKLEVEREALQVINHEKKVKAILSCAQMLSEVGWDNYKASLIHADLPHQLKQLEKLPYIGPAMRRQLAGAIGIDAVAKPDIHLRRVALKYWGSDTEDGVQEFTERIASLVGERVKVVDYVLWRYSEGSRNAV